MYSMDEAKRIYATMNDEQKMLFRDTVAEIEDDTLAYLLHGWDECFESAAEWDAYFPAPETNEVSASVGLLVSFGLTYDEAAALTKEQAFEAIAKFKKTTCTNKQKHVLRRYGYPEMPFDQASEVIKQLADNGWKRP